MSTPNAPVPTGVPSELPELDVLCRDCEGAGGCSINGLCGRCNGVGRAPTPLGEHILDFVFRHLMEKHGDEWWRANQVKGKR
jgi:Tryptophan RNA-binding attenuator protein inhibitory protein